MLCANLWKNFHALIVHLVSALCLCKQNRTEMPRWRISSTMGACSTHQTLLKSSSQSLKMLSLCFSAGTSFMPKAWLASCFFFRVMNLKKLAALSTVVSSLQRLLSFTHSPDCTSSRKQQIRACPLSERSKSSWKCGGVSKVFSAVHVKKFLVQWLL